MIQTLLRTFMLLVLVATSIAPKSSTASAPAASTSLEVQEQLLVDEIDRQADAIFEKLKREQPELPVNILQKTQRQAVYRLRQMHVLTDVLKAAGPSPAIALVAGEILSTFVFAPLFAAKGNLLAASIAMTVPWGIIAGAAAASFEMLKHRLKIARDLNSSLGALRQADKIREIIVGYDVKHRISTVMFEAMSESLSKEIEFEVVKKMRDAEKARTPFVTLAEVEALVRSTPEGTKFLENIYFERLDRALFSALMIRYLNEHDVLAEKLLDLLETRVPSKSVETPELRKHLLAVDDLKRMIARDLTAIQAEVKATKKKVKDGSMTKAQADRSKAYLKDEVKRLQAARGDVVRHEYALLLDVKAEYLAKDVAAVEATSHEYDRSLALLRNSSRHVPLKPVSLAPPPQSSRPAPAATYGPRQCSNVFGAAIAR